MTATQKYDSTGNIRFGAGLALSDQTEYITQNSTGDVILPASLTLTRTSILPTVRVSGGIVFVYNSTAAAVAFHSTGTTWKYANITSVLA